MNNALKDMFKLYMIVLGGRPSGRYTEQHDVFFGIAEELSGLYKSIDAFWPAVAGRWHIDSWREVNWVDGYQVRVSPRRSGGQPAAELPARERLYFINLGGYKENDLEEYHYKLLTVAPDTETAVKKAKLTAFYKHVGFGGTAISHVDDKYSVDVDDLYELESILPVEMRAWYQIELTPSASGQEDTLHIGYLKRG